MTRRRLSVFAVLFFASHALAWGNFESHDQVTERILEGIETDPALARMFREELGFPLGLDERLVLQLGLDAEVDADLAPYLGELVGSRLTQSWNSIEAFRPAPGGLGLVPNSDYCSRSVDRAACNAQLGAAPDGASTAKRLLRLGVWAEDNPNPRARHHFHDPEREHGDDRGLDNTEILLVPLAELLTEAITFYLRGGDGEQYSRYLADFRALGLLPGDPGNFQYEGRAALDRAVGSFEASQDLPRNVFSLADAEEYLYRGLTAEYPDEREGFLALHLLAVGHALHILEDASSPPHVRNDFVVEHGWGSVFGTSIESKGEAEEGLAARVLEGSPVPDLDTAGFDVSDFFVRDARPSPHDASGSRGLAEYVHDRFLSEGSLEGGSPTLWYQGYAKPALPACGDLDDSAGSGLDLVQVRDLPDRDLETGAAVPDSTQRYLTHRAGKRLAACRMYQLSVSAFVPVPGGATPTTWNDGVRRDYYEHLWPLAVAYGHEFLKFYYQPRLEVIPTGPRTFKLANPTMLELEIPTGGVLLVYGTRDTITGLERRVSVPLGGCGAGGPILLEPAVAPGSLGPEWPFECELPAQLAASPPLDPTQFWIVARGRHGERGRVDGPGDRVVAFDRITAEIFYGATRDGRTYGTDAEVQSDVFRVLPSLRDPASSVATNLTAPMRSVLQARNGLTDVERDEIDFSRPSVDVAGERIMVVISTKEQLALAPNPTEQDPLDPSQRISVPTGIAVAPIDSLGSDPEAFREVDLQGLSLEWLTTGSPSFDRTPGSRALVFRAHDAPPPGPSNGFLVTQDADSDQQSRIPMDERHWVFSAFGNRLATMLDGRGIRLVNRVTGVCESYFDVAQVLPGCQGADQEEQQWPQFSPDGRFVVYQHVRQLVGGVERAILIADLTTGQIRELRDDAGNLVEGHEPSVAPDGGWILFTRLDGELAIAPVAGGRALQLTTDGEGKAWARWRAGLVLPSR